MVDMKFDMAGGAAVIETMAALADLEAPINVLGVVGATENMISGAAMRPGDILTALDGTTVEMNNADAEGRLVLGDCITYARREGCDAIVDIATLTGGVVVALGSVYAGLMSNDDALAELVTACGRAHRRAGVAAAAAPRVRRDGQGPLRPDHQPHRAPRGVGDHRRRSSCTTSPATCRGRTWTSPASATTAAQPYLDKGGTGFGVRLLTELALSF